jgi:hypothetical protein
MGEGTRLSKILCAPADYNPKKLQVMFKVSPAMLQTFIDTRLTLTPSIIHNSNYVIMVGDLNCLKYCCVFLYFKLQVHRVFDHPVFRSILVINRTVTVPFL